MGGRDTVIGFKALGLDTFPVSGDDEAKSVFHHLTKTGKDYAIIYLEETFAKALASEIDGYKDGVTPAIILIPGREGPSASARAPAGGRRTRCRRRYLIAGKKVDYFER